MVVQQLHKKCQDRDKSARWHSLSEQKIKDLCLVAVIGGQEKCFRDDFKPLQLQNPWRRGKLYLRLRSEALAASSSGYFTSVWRVNSYVVIIWLPKLIGILFPLRKTSKRASLSVKQKVKRADHEKAEILLMRQKILVAGKTMETI